MPDEAMLSSEESKSPFIFNIISDKFNGKDLKVQFSFFAKNDLYLNGLLFIYRGIKDGQEIVKKEYPLESLLRKQTGVQKTYLEAESISLGELLLETPEITDYQITIEWDRSSDLKRVTSSETEGNTSIPKDLQNTIGVNEVKTDKTNYSNELAQGKTEKDKSASQGEEGILSGSPLKKNGNIEESQRQDKISEDTRVKNLSAEDHKVAVEESKVMTYNEGCTIESCLYTFFIKSGITNNGSRNLESIMLNFTLFEMLKSSIIDTRTLYFKDLALKPGERKDINLKIKKKLPNIFEYTEQNLQKNVKGMVTVE
jgi:hypothetical protein